VRYDDGEMETNVQPTFIRLIGGGGLVVMEEGNNGVSSGGGHGGKKEEKELFEKGDWIEARFRARSKWLPGRVARVNSDETYDVRYDDGEMEQGVDPSLVRRPVVKPPTTTVSSRRDGGGSSNKDDDGTMIDSGDRVEARLRGRSKWHTDHVIRVNRDGTYDIHYDDGEKEQGVDASLIRRPGAQEQNHDDRDIVLRGMDVGARTADPEKFARGDHVEARFRGRSKWVAGMVLRVNGDETLDIRYEDDELEQWVDPSLVRRPPLGGSPGRKFITNGPANTTTTTGSGGGSTSTAANNQGRQEERGGKKQQQQQQQQPAGPFSDYDVGHRVEARFRGRNKWVVGKVVRRNSDHTFDIEYEDGNGEENVYPSFIRPLGPSSTTTTTTTNSNGNGVSMMAMDLDPKGFNVGDRVEARYRGGSRWYAAGVTNVRSGSFDIYDLQYDDGDVEKCVDPSCVRRGGCDGPVVLKNIPLEKFVVGDLVEARLLSQGRLRWFPGKVTATNLNGTYGVLFEEQGQQGPIEPSYVRRAGAWGPLLKRSPSSRGSKMISK